MIEGLPDRFGQGTMLNWNKYKTNLSFYILIHWKLIFRGANDVYPTFRADSNGFVISEYPHSKNFRRLAIHLLFGLALSSLLLDWSQAGGVDGLSHLIGRVAKASCLACGQAGLGASTNKQLLCALDSVHKWVIRAVNDTRLGAMQLMERGFCSVCESRV